MLAAVKSVELDFEKRELSNNGAELAECCRDSVACTTVTSGENLGGNLEELVISSRIA